MLQTDVDFLTQPHAKASLAAHLNFWLKYERHKSPLTGEALKFFDLDDVELSLKSLRFADYELPNLHRALKRLFRHWRLDFVGGEVYQYGAALWAPTYRRVEVRPRRFATYLRSGSLFFRLPQGGKRVVLLDEERDPPEINFVLLGPRDEREQLNREAAAIVRWCKRHHYLRGQALRADATLLDTRQAVSWDDVALSPQVRSALEENTLGILRRRALFKRNGIPQKRGVLLYGPPGTGKTMVGRALAASRAATFVWATAADVTNSEALRRVFTLARKLKPAIVFLEDMDLYASERGGASDATLGELLSQMDGLEQNDGIIVMATTNDLAAIEPALRERPSRFDVVLEIGLPETAARRRILERNTARQAPAGEVLDWAATATDGLAGAQVREVAFLAIQRAILRGATTNEGLARLEQGDLTAAIEQITGKKRRAAIGFSAGASV